ncbi:MAG: hypothetical protein FWH48_05135 [Oscillospiraceae bacterium]|nr:hypothetical protein [Oscillospiraceae bacterium]MCL2158775.1 hypothetical protein [Oscillospiraceae bacterium]
MKKNKNNQTTTKKIALAALLSALGIIFLVLGSLFEALDLSAAAFAGFVVAMATIELGGEYPVMIYFAISVLSVLVLPNKYPALYFMFFLGVYPIAKAYFERFHPVVSWIIKFSLFNTVFAFMILALNFLVGRGFLPPFEEGYLSEHFKGFKIIVFVVANFVFLLYDIAMTKILSIYIVKIRKAMGLNNYF